MKTRMCRPAITEINQKNIFFVKWIDHVHFWFFQSGRPADTQWENMATIWRGRKRCSLRGFLGSKECRHFVMLSGFPFLLYLFDQNKSERGSRVL
jgi:hypothetical protein